MDTDNNLNITLSVDNIELTCPFNGFEREINRIIFNMNNWQQVNLNKIDITFKKAIDTYHCYISSHFGTKTVFGKLSFLPEQHIMRTSDGE